MNNNLETAWALIALEFRTVSGGKATTTADDQRKAELAMQTQAFQTQQDQLAMLNKNFSPYLAGKTGFDPQMLANLRSQFLNSNASTFNQAGNATRAALGARGEGTGSAPVGGTYGSGIANLMAAKAGSQSSGLMNIDLQNAQQALQNQFNAGNILSGNAATQTGTQGVAGAGASSALQSYVTASANSFGGSLASSLGKSLGSMPGQAGSIMGGCWIAAACWGWGDPRTNIVRLWLNTEFMETWYGRLVMKLYYRYGQKVAQQPWLVRILRPLFELALKKAQAWDSQA